MDAMTTDIILEILDIDKQIALLECRKKELQTALDWYKEKEVEADLRFDGSDFIGE